MKINIKKIRFKIAKWIMNSIWTECTKEIEDGVKELLETDYSVGEIIKRWSFFYQQPHNPSKKRTDGVWLQITAKLTKLTKETKNEESIIDDKFIDDLIGRRMR